MKPFLNRIYYYTKKLKAIEYLGAKCAKCGEDEQFKLCFHHTDSQLKDEQLSLMFGKRWELVKIELDKCELLCFNCHMETHYGSNDRKEKKILLEFKGKLSCEICGYDKCMASLNFHHIDPNNKDFRLASIMHLKYENIQTLKKYIEDELDKCNVLCSNCHKYLHSDVEFFNINKELIYSKIDNLKTQQPKIDRLKIKKMYDDGVKQIDIAKYFNASKSTISLIIKSLKNEL